MHKIYKQQYKTGQGSVDIILRDGKTRDTKIGTIDNAKPQGFMKGLKRGGTPDSINIRRADLTSAE